MASLLPSNSTQLHFCINRLMLYELVKLNVWSVIGISDTYLMGVWTLSRALEDFQTDTDSN